jgi:hypothetical protein
MGKFTDGSSLMKQKAIPDSGMVGKENLTEEVLNADKYCELKRLSWISLLRLLLLKGFINGAELIKLTLEFGTGFFLLE